MRKGASQELRIGKERCRRAVDGKCSRDDDCSGLTQQKVGGTAAAPAVLRCALGVGARDGAAKGRKWRPQSKIHRLQ